MIPDPGLSSFVDDLQVLREILRRHCVRPHTASALYQLREEQSRLRKQADALRARSATAADRLAARRRAYLGTVSLETAHRTLISAKTGMHSAPWELEAKALEQYGFSRREIKRRSAEYRKRKYLARRWGRRLDGDPLRDASTIEGLIFFVLKDCEMVSGLRSNRVRISYCKRALISVDSLIILSINAMINRDIVFEISYALTAIPIGKASRASG